VECDCTRPCAVGRAGPPLSRRAADKAMKSAAVVVAEYLDNTPAVARGSYMDPRVLERYRSGWTIEPEIAQLGLRSRGASTWHPLPCRGGSPGPDLGALGVTESALPQCILGVAGTHRAGPEQHHVHLQ
jgi:hypothetical protein